MPLEALPDLTALSSIRQLASRKSLQCVPSVSPLLAPSSEMVSMARRGQGDAFGRGSKRKNLCKLHCRMVERKTRCPCTLLRRFTQEVGARESRSGTRLANPETQPSFCRGTAQIKTFPLVCAFLSQLVATLHDPGRVKNDRSSLLTVSRT